MTPRPRVLACIGAVCLTSGWLPFAAAQVAVGSVTEPLRLAQPVHPVKGGSAIYIVKLKDVGAASYKGIAAAGATKPAEVRPPDVHSAAVAAYAKRLELTHDRLLAEVGAPQAKVYSFRYALNGFAARLSAAQVSRLAQKPEVERIWLDSDQHADTNNSAIFLGLEDQHGGLRADLKLRGEGVVVGLIDSGIAPNHPSLLDTEDRTPRACQTHWSRASWLGVFLCASYRRNPPTELVFDPAPASFRGVCETGEGFGPTACDNKVVGARFYLDGFLFRHALDPNEFRSPHDAAGHGTHVATIVAGNPVDAQLLGTRVARVSGIAPRARIAIYKACWLEPGATTPTCATSDLTRAIDDAVADGVDIINYSLGSLETPLSDPDDLALLNAFDAGVLTVVAAGNDGPDLGMIGSPSSAPWVVTAAASTQSGELFDEAIEITAPDSLAGAISMRQADFTPQLKSGKPLEEALIEVDDGQGQLQGGAGGTTRDACQKIQNGDDVDGHIALIERGGCEFQLKISNAQDAGAAGVVVYNNAGSPIVMNGDAGSVDIPAVMIGAADGRRLLDALAAGDEVRVELARGTFVAFAVEGNQVADFSSRGPSLSDPSFLKPDVTAPGVDILGGAAPDVANGLRGEQYQYLSGTSQAAPEVTGVLTLLKEAHPDWPPGTLKSALLTTARRNVVRSDGVAADPFDMGAGHIDANRAIDPGLVYPNEFRDYAAYLCGLIEPPFPEADCAALAAAGFKREAPNVNQPSVASAELITGDIVTRRVTNIGPAATFTAQLSAPLDIGVFVEPPSLALGTGQAAEFTLRFANHGAPLDTWRFGTLTWVDGTHTVASPIAVQPVALRTTPELHLNGRSGSTKLPAAFGYSGTYLSSVHGLRAPFLDATTGAPPAGAVDDDPTNNFSFRFDNGVTAHRLIVPPGQLYLRVALFDEFTDGDDDLDLYLFFCPGSACTQIAQSGRFTSDEEINVTFPQPGVYLALVHGFETDQVAGGPGAKYSLFTWSFGANDDVGNLDATTPQTVAEGDRLEFDVRWSGLDPNTRYLGAIAHDTPFGLYALTIVNIETH